MVLVWNGHGVPSLGWPAIARHYPNDAHGRATVPGVPLQLRVGREAMSGLHCHPNPSLPLRPVSLHLADTPAQSGR